MLCIWLNLMICISKPAYEMQHAFFISDLCLRKWKLSIALRCTHFVLSKLNLFKPIFPWLYKHKFFLHSTLCLSVYVFVCMDEQFVPNSIRNICKKDIFHWQWQHARNIPQLLLSSIHVCASAQTQHVAKENLATV